MLQSSLETSEKKYLEMCHRYEKAIEEKDEMRIKLHKYESESNALANLLRKFYVSLIYVVLKLSLRVHYILPTTFTMMKSNVTSSSCILTKIFDKSSSIFGQKHTRWFYTRT